MYGWCDVSMHTSEKYISNRFLCEYDLILMPLYRIDERKISIRSVSLNDM